MIRRIFALSLSLLVALSGAPELRAQVVSRGANAAVPRISGTLGTTLSAPALSPLTGPSALSLDSSLAPALAAPSLAPALAASAIPAAAKPVAPAKAAAPAAAKAALPAAPSTEGRTPAQIAALRQAWQTAHALVEDVPDAPQTLAEAPISAEPLRAYTASPADWRDEILHFMLLDRFARAGKVRTHGDPTKGGSRHGGNLRGVIEQLDYLKNSGVTTLLLSPVNQNQADSYHGYAPVHLLAIDPHLGTMADFKELVLGAHQRGMRVVLDWVLNHSGPVFEYTEGSQWRGLEGEPKEIGEWTESLLPSDLKDPKHFTRRGVIDNWSDHAQATNGDFPPNYRHYASDKKETADALIHIAKWWIQETDIDGFRVDAVRHIAPGFVPVFSKAIKEYAASIGKKNFFLVGENSTGIDSDLIPHLTTDGMDSAFSYPAYRRETYALHGKAPTRVLEDSMHRTNQVLGPLADRLLRFIDNHDVYRFLRLGEPEAQLKVALAYLLFSVGIPMTYYGTEQGFRQDTDRLDPEGPDHPADPRNREDQFADGQFKSESSKGDKFDTSNPTYQFMKRLADVRIAYAALRRGAQWVRWSEPAGTGLFAFSRIYDGQEVVVAINFGTKESTQTMWVDATLSPKGAVFKDALEESYRVETLDLVLAVGSQITVSVPPLSVRVLVRDAK
ncbi:MAG: alpha-amylase family glycosyl hydrolase [Elusimicrobiota bacterium]|nr:alpha-amylase family glycosyl hydrolase [Elusimicrobiota bacterium]